VKNWEPEFFHYPPGVHHVAQGQKRALTLLRALQAPSLPCEAARTPGSYCQGSVDLSNWSRPQGC
jgi:hypothetical protein